MKSVLILSGTELIAAVILNADRIILQAVDGGTSVTVFYAATLIGKMVSLISMPLNGVIIGHLSKYNGKLKKSTFTKICLGSVAAGFIHSDCNPDDYGYGSVGHGNFTCYSKSVKDINDNACW